MNVKNGRAALLIGAPNGLKGVDRDLEVVEAALTGRSFRCRRCTGSGAKRVGILAALQTLADDAIALEEAVIYYSGHGARVPNRGFERVLRGHYQKVRFFPMILPNDWTCGGVGDFRGILVAELEVYFQKIVAAGARLTIIFDCCHASAVVRSAGEIEGREPPRAHGSWGGVASPQGGGLAEGSGIRTRTLTLDTPCLAGLERHFEDLAKRGIAMTTLAAECNPAVVRLVASDEGQAAFERPVEAVILDGGIADPVVKGETLGVMTAALVRALAELGSQPWHVVGRRVRALAAAHSGQRVSLKGPHRRLPFSGQEDGPRRIAGITAIEDSWTLDVGSMCGVEVGDRFFVWPRKPSKGPTPALVEVVVTRVDASRAWVEPVGASASATLGAHATVSPSGYGRARGRVRLVATTGGGEGCLPEVIPGAGGLATMDDEGIDAAIMAEVIETDGTLEVRRPGGGLLRDRVDFQPDLRPGIADLAITFVREALEDLLVAHSLIHLEPTDSALLRRVDWSIERRSKRGRESFEARGEVEPIELEDGDDLVVDVWIVDQSTNPLFVWILMVGPGGRVSLLSGRAPAGLEITKDAPYTLGLRPDGARVGERMRWPMSGVPRPSQGGDRGGFIVLVVADAPADLTVWGTDPVNAWQTKRDLLEAKGATRSWSEPMPEGRALRWGVERVRLDFDA
ncbi:MAG: caspase family protein [Nannocystaceae bacterium]